MTLKKIGEPEGTLGMIKQAVRIEQPAFFANKNPNRSAQRWSRHLLVWLLLMFAGGAMHMSVAAQSTSERFFIEGLVTDADTGEPLSGVIITAQASDTDSATSDQALQGTTSDAMGLYRLKLPAGGKYLVRFRLLGYQEVTREMAIQGSSVQHDEALTKDSQLLDEVTIVGKSHAQRLREVPSFITVIDAKDLRTKSISTEEILNQAVGVKVNQSGGLGSHSRIIIQGLDGKRVGIFVNGVSVGNSDTFDLNSIPTDHIERLEIYKGVVPAWLGGDGLGGAINIILRATQRDHLGLSYEIGSYQTHKASLASSYTIKPLGIQVAFNAAFDYARNNYAFNSPFELGRRVLRDHDVYRHTRGTLAIQTNRLWWDALGISIGYSTLYDEIQGGLLTIQQAVRHAHTNGRSLQGSVLMEKTMLEERLHLLLNTLIQQSCINLVDTSMYAYDFDGRRFPSPTGLGEVGHEPNDSHDQYMAIHSLLNAKYRLSPQWTLNLNTQVKYHRKRPNDPLADSYLKYPVSGFPSDLFSIISGLSYTWKHPKELWSNEGGIKYYQHRSAIVPMAFFQEKPQQHICTSRNIGYSQAVNWKPIEGLTLKAALQKNLRIPTADELFGDAVLVLTAVDLRPEVSYNANLGANILWNFGSYPNLRLDFNSYYMQVRDMITLLSQGLTMRHSNIGRAQIMGTELELVSELTPWCTIMANGTYTDARDKTPEMAGGGENYHYNYRIPNIPFLFGNAEVNLHFEDLLAKGSKISLYTSTHFTERFSYDWEKHTESTLDIPQKWLFDAGIYFGWKERYHLTLEVHNLLDKEHWAEFQYPLPGRTLHCKVRLTL